MTRYELVQSELRQLPRRWLVTGVAGFIGSHLLETLLKLDQQVVGLDNFSTGKQENLDEVRSLVTPEQWARFQFIEGDIRDPQACQKASRRVRYVLHQAALGSVPRSIKEPLRTHENNVTGFVNMVLAARDQAVKRFIYASSSSVYGDLGEQPKVESKVGRPLSPYAAGKVTCELYAEVFARAYGLETIGLRYFNVFGPRQDPEGPYAAVIPKWLTAMLKGEQAYINGDGETSRDFCYVDNVVQANLLAATASFAHSAGPETQGAGNESQPGISSVYNVAVGQRTTLRQLYQIIQDRLRRLEPALPSQECTYRRFRSGDIRHSLADISRAIRELGYSPQVSIGSGLDLLLRWWVASRLSDPPSRPHRSFRESEVNLAHEKSRQDA